MIVVPVEKQAKLSRNAAMGDGDWNGTVPERVREYLALDVYERQPCVLQTTTPIIFSDDLPARDYLNSNMIEMLADRMARRGELD